MLWGTSSLALYIPWAGKAGPYLGICLWLWLGVLDAIQGVGLGMILLQVKFLYFVLPSYMSLIYIYISSDTVTTPRLRDFGILADHRFNLCDGCPCYCPQQNWTRKCLPRCGDVGLPEQRTERKPYGFSSLLDCTCLSAYHRCWVFLVLPQGAAW